MRRNAYTVVLGTPLLGVAALAIIDATVRLLPGAMSDLDSARTDSFFDRGISAPSYTRPAEFRGWAVPEVLLSGDHAKIATWRLEQSHERTLKLRPDLLSGTSEQL